MHPSEDITVIAHAPLSRDDQSKRRPDQTAVVRQRTPHQQLLARDEGWEDENDDLDLTQFGGNVRWEQLFPAVEARRAQEKIASRVSGTRQLLSGVSILGNEMECTQVAAAPQFITTGPIELPRGIEVWIAKMRRWIRSAIDHLNSTD
ncbi:hypothetical protein COV82_00525 [Candidatus Peregrinibacteria bacterium CG11_big_fil_rev_8_21_14_0_20_46_8]|nr:MAG: hypothetical protein COV82_00525 [Candidatus Peregrinibacteria bacterium CG11_big_fil_rev_8_21_14_0_20_46_8]